MGTGSRAQRAKSRATRAPGLHRRQQAQHWCSLGPGGGGKALEGSLAAAPPWSGPPPDWRQSLALQQFSAGWTHVAGKARLAAAGGALLLLDFIAPALALAEADRLPGGREG
jgi:hypothetical protein